MERGHQSPVGRFDCNRWHSTALDCCRFIRLSRLIRLGAHPARVPAPYGVHAACRRFRPRHHSKPSPRLLPRRPSNPKAAASRTRSTPPHAAPLPRIRRGDAPHYPHFLLICHFFLRNQEFVLRATLPRKYGLVSGYGARTSRPQAGQRNADGTSALYSDLDTGHWPLKTNHLLQQVCEAPLNPLTPEPLRRCAPFPSLAAGKSGTVVFQYTAFTM